MKLSIFASRLAAVSFFIGLGFACFATSLVVAQTEDSAQTGESASLLQKFELVEKPSLMLKNWLLGQIDQKKIEWQTRYETLETLEDVERYQKERIDFFWRQLGTLWEKTPLNAQITGTIVKDGYRVEKIVFESVPQFFVTGTLFLPDETKYSAPYPALLVVCGHSNEGKAFENYQNVAELAALNGLAAFVVDPIDQGERLQHLNADGTPYAVGVPAHNIVGAGSILLGRNAATFEIWDMVRALDYLQSRPDVIPDRLGVAGNSGGGTQTSYIMALDPRVAVAAPACYLCSLFDNLTHKLGPQDAEQNIFGQIGFGMDHADYCVMRAPKPTLLCVATKDFFNIDDAWRSFRYAKRIYSRWTLAEKIAIIEKDAPHGYGKELRESTVRWTLRWLAGRDELTTEPENMPQLSEQEMKSIEGNGVLSLPNAKTTYDLNRDLEREFAAKRQKIWESISADDAAKLLRRVAGIRTLDELPKPVCYRKDEISNAFVLETDPGVFLPIRTNGNESDANASDSSTNGDARTLTLVVDDGGRFSDKVDSLFRRLGDARTENDGSDLATATDSDSNWIAAVDLRGWGETQGIGQNYYNYEFFGQDGSEYYLAYLLGKSYVGLRTDDLLSVAKFLRDEYRVQIRLVAFGLAGTVALHAKIVEPDLFESIEIEQDAIPNWSSLIERSPTPIPLSNAIHGVLEFYDVDNLVEFVEK